MITVDGRWYDTSRFKHPGGVIIRAAEGDATAIFEMHHPRSRAKALEALSSLDTTVVTLGPARAFSATYAVLCSALRISDADVRRAADIVFVKALVLLVLLAHAFYFHARGHILATAALPFLLYMFAAQAMHDAGHECLGLGRRRSAFLRVVSAAMGVGGDPRWVFKHLRHHARTNEATDPELHVHWLMRLLPSQEWRWYHRFMPYYALVIYSLLHLSIAGDQMRAQPRRERAGVDIYVERPWVWQCTRVAFWTLHVGLPLLLGGGVRSVLWAVVLFCPASLLVSLLFQVAHVGTAQFDAGSHDAPDWCDAQIAASVDYSPDSWLITHLTGGLNLQLEHHIFPTIPHPLLPRVRALCAPHHPAFRSAHGSLWAAAVDHVRALGIRARAP